MSGGGGKGKKPRQVQVVPANVSTGFGTAVANPRTGEYSYNLDPRLAQMRDIFYGGAQQFVPSQEMMDFSQGVVNQGMGLFGQGSQLLNQALATDTAGLGQQYYSDIQRLMQTDRAEEEARLANNLFRTGRTGAAVGTQGGYVNPEQFALLRARELANQQLAIQAEELGRGRRMQDVGFATGLQGQGLQQYGQGFAAGVLPYETTAGVFGLGTGIEQLGMQPLGVGLQALQSQFAQQQQQQAYENARAASGGKGGLGGVLGGVSSVFGNGWGTNLLNAGANWYTGGLSSATGMAGGVGKPAWMYSDERLKTNITPIGKYKNGLNKYSFDFVAGGKSEGVLAQEVLKVMPDAVRVADNGYYEVDYSKVGE